jgi:energy-coupling factor transporter ATP-binding protein EcfA2
MATPTPEQATVPRTQDWRTLTPVQRLQQVEDILIRHARFNALWAELDYCAQFGLAVRTAEPPCLAILGHTGAGKSTLMDAWIAQARREETPEGCVIPYLSTLIPARASIKGAAAAFLRKLGDPNPDRGTEWSQIGRLLHLIRACRVQMLFVDEVQHIMDKNTERVLHHVSDFLKTIIIETHIPMILIGRQGEANPVLKANSQLARRVGSPRILEPFAWDRTKPETIQEFRVLLHQIDAALPLDRSGLAEEQMAFRFYYATRGYLGWIMQMIRYAASAAIQRDCSRLHLELLAEAYQARIAGTALGFGRQNPFTEAFSETAAEVQVERAKQSEQVAQPSVSKRRRKKDASTGTTPVNASLTKHPQRRQNTPATAS